MTVTKAGDRPFSVSGTLSAIAVAGSAVLALVGCATRHPTDQIPTAVTRHESSGYIAQQASGSTSITEVWTVGGRSVDINATLPDGSGPYPLVLYLPGLGESPDAGLPWRQAWAGAGYAVLSVQPTSVGEAIWKSTAARAAEFHAIAQEQFSSRSLADRVATLYGALDELKRRQNARNAGAFSRIDASRVAVAGFDLGAQAAMVVAGERIDDGAQPRFTEAVKCVIALSPYADFSGMGIASRFRSVRMPVLSVTSTDDTDPYGLVGSAAVRQAPYQYMPPGQKYLLLLSSASHSLLAGKAAAGAERPDGKGGERPGASREADGDGGGVYGSRRRRGDRAGARSGGSAASSPPQRGQAVLPRLEITDVRHVSVAFLDATVKNDPVAWEWLAKDAQRWLGDTATLSSK